MGYFSNLAIDYRYCDCDHSYTPPEKQLLWRLEDLEERLRELLEGTVAVLDECVFFPREDLRYILPGQLRSVSAVRKAIDLAVEDLADRYGIYIREKVPEEPPQMDELTGMQISFLDIFSLQALQSAA